MRRFGSVAPRGEVLSQLGLELAAVEPEEGNRGAEVRTSPGVGGGAGQEDGRVSEVGV